MTNVMAKDSWTGHSRDSVPMATFAKYRVVETPLRTSVMALKLRFNTSKRCPRMRSPLNKITCAPVSM